MWWLRILVLLLMTGAIPTSPSLLAPSLDSVKVEEPSNDVTAFPADWMSPANITEKEEPTTVPSLLNSSMNSTSPDVLTTSPPLLTSPLDSSKQNDSSIDRVVLLDASATPSNWTETEDFSTLNGDDEPSTAPSEATTDNEHLTSTESLPIDDESKDANDKEVDSSSERGDSPQAAPSQSESGDESKSTLNLTALDALSASDLKSKLYLAKNSLELAKNKTADAERELNKKRQEAKEPNRDYEEKKKEWERLDKLAEDMAENWKKDEEAARDAADDLAAVMLRINSANQTLIREQADLAKFPGKIEKAKAVLAEIEGRPTRLAELKDNKIKKVDGKPLLQPRINGLVADEKQKLKDWTTAKKPYDADKDKYERDKCEDPVLKASTCDSTKLAMDGSRPKAERAEEEYNKTKRQLEEAKLELANYDTDLQDIEDAINDLVTIETDYQSDWNKANKTIANLERNEGLKKERVEKWEETMKKAEEEAVPLRTANEAANEKVKNGRPPEIGIAEGAAGRALSEMNTANQTKKIIDEKVKALEIELDLAKAAEKKEEANVAVLNGKFEMAAKREERKDKSSNTIGIVLGSVFGVLIIAGIIIGVIFYIRRKKDCTRLPKGKDTKKLDSRTPSSGAGTAVPPARQPLTNEGPLQTLIGLHPLVPDPAGQGPTIENECPNLKDKPFIPGEEPFKIPARNFKWRGPMRRRTRWHGPPDHDFEGKNNGVETVDKVWFDPNANYATEIGPNEIIEDGGPPSDSDRSEWLNDLETWEKGHAALLAAQAAKPGNKKDRDQIEKEKEEKKEEQKRGKERKQTMKKKGEKRRDKKKKRKYKKGKKRVGRSEDSDQEASNKSDRTDVIYEDTVHRTQEAAYRMREAEAGKSEKRKAKDAAKADKKRKETGVRVEKSKRDGGNDNKTATKSNEGSKGQGGNAKEQLPKEKEIAAV